MANYALDISTFFISSIFQGFNKKNTYYITIPGTFYIEKEHLLIPNLCYLCGT